MSKSRKEWPRLYDEKRFNRIIELSNQKKINQALHETMTYIDDFPKDISAYLLEADIYMKMGLLKDAEDILDNIIESSELSNLKLQRLRLMKIKLLCCKQQYSECLELVRNNFDAFDTYNWPLEAILLFLKKQLSLLSDVDYSTSNYFINQVYSYSEEEALNYIKNNQHVDAINGVSHFFDVNMIEKIYYKLREILPLDIKSYNSILSNTYIFKCDSIGMVYNKKVNYIKVVTLQGSNEIVIMHPYENKERFPYIDLTPYLDNYDNLKIDKIKTTQIDKFNRRYLKTVDKN